MIGAADKPFYHKLYVTSEEFSEMMEIFYRHIDVNEGAKEVRRRFGLKPYQLYDVIVVDDWSHPVRG
jgi:hypothetical protein